MITGFTDKNQFSVKQNTRPYWQQVLSQSYRRPEALLQYLELDGRRLKNLAENTQSFSMLVSPGYASRMRKRDWHDPLLAQVLPMDDESNLVKGFSFDPVDDQGAMIADGVLHKYHGRVLVVTTGACAIHCRYCFRRHFPYGDANAAKDQWHSVLSSVAADASISEVILSGGDPLTITDERLKALCFSLAEIPHVKRLRIHSRLPIVLPERLDHQFFSWFEQLPLQKIMVIHANHAREFDVSVADILKKLRQRDVLLFNQGVLLKRVNDSVEALSDLSECLIEHHVVPYYLNLLDKVQGAAHFEVCDKDAIRLIQKIKEKLPGYMVPRLVRDIDGNASKTLM